MKCIITQQIAGQSEKLANRNAFFYCKKDAQIELNRWHFEEWGAHSDTQSLSPSINNNRKRLNRYDFDNTTYRVQPAKNFMTEKEINQIFNY